jgi:uncharacterized phage protein (TIGR02218 family)
MRAIDPALQAHLDSGATTLATCWRIARRDGAVFGFTEHDRALSFAGTLYEPETGADGSALASSADLAVDNGEISGVLSSDRLRPAELLSGRFDGAAVEIWRVNWAAPDERLLMKRGVIGEVRREGARFTAEIRGAAQALNQPRGRLYQRLCDANVGDARCGADLDQPSFRANGAVTAAHDDARFEASGLAGFADQWFALGRLDWLSGANAGTSGHVKAQAGGTISLWAPAGLAIAIGDGFELRAGCDKRFETCRAKFANVVNFRGFHLMPGDDVAVSYPLRSELNDGGRR